MSRKNSVSGRGWRARVEGEKKVGGARIHMTRMAIFVIMALISYLFTHQTRLLACAGGKCVTPPQCQIELTVVDQWRSFGRRGSDSER